MKASIPASQRQFCSACGDVSRNILRIITSELDVRTSKGKDEYTWECDISTITQTARGCTFCRFVKYVFLKPYYDPQSLKAVPWRSASNVKDLTEEELSTLRYLVARGGSACAICENTIFTGAGGVCYLCKPRLVRYLATEEHRFDVHASWTLPFQLTFQKACWAVDENADMEGLAITTTSKQPLDTNDQLFRVDCLDENDPAAEYVHLGDRVSSFDEPRVMERVISLLKDCDANHDCGPDSPAQARHRPTRLINIHCEDEGRTVRLCDGATAEPYVALSHCWGGRQSLLTRKANLEQHQQAIPTSELAQTVRDAIHVTRYLGIRLLWVDCLCIIQDDKQDKSREIGKMRDVYANAYLTIGAGRAQAASEGFLHTKTEPFYMDAAAVAADLTDENSSHSAKAQSRSPEDVSGSLPVVLPSDKVGRVNVRRRVEYSSALDPLVARAWTYEERMLSKRIVNFGQCVTWRCLRDHSLLDSTGDAWYATDEKNVNSIRGEPHATALQPQRLLRRWHDLVTAYSTRSMYDETDKLPAIAGIVQQIQSDGDPKAYFAGLWRSQLASDMMWCAPRHGSKPSQWRAPSWSWASVNGMVRFQDAQDMVQGSDVLISDVVYRSELANEAAPFGELQSAFLYLTGRIGAASRGLVAWKSPYSDASTAFEEILCDPKHPATILYEGTSRLKIDLEEDSLRIADDKSFVFDSGVVRLMRVEPVWCLPLHGVVDYEPNDSWDDDMLETRLDGLLLRKTAEGSYSRIGIFELAKHDPGEYFTWSEPGRVQLI